VEKRKADSAAFVYDRMDGVLFWRFIWRLIVPGTGDSLTMQWDDRPSGQAAAVFSLEEFGGEAFSPSL
jgi:hypothetical protein